MEQDEIRAMAERFAEEITATLERMLSRSIKPMVIIGANMMTKHVQAFAVGKVERDLMKTLVARVLVSEIDPLCLPEVEG